jgi:hypothetical protein
MFISNHELDILIEEDVPYFDFDRLGFGNSGRTRENNVCRPDIPAPGNRSGRFDYAG